MAISCFGAKGLRLCDRALWGVGNGKDEVVGCNGYHLAGRGLVKYLHGSLTEAEFVVLFDVLYASTKRDVVNKGVSIHGFGSDECFWDLIHSVAKCHGRSHIW
jgi:hypothetical protein